ncbi:MAG: hypothetical protein HYY95_22465 [Candidatus Rokubacteria bacterium]|nr:hypothetical protein [Candidatus Rokubacteria bacterium]
MRAVATAVVLAVLTIASGLGDAEADSAGDTAQAQLKARAYLQAADAALAVADHAAAVTFLEKAVDAAPGDRTVRDRLAEAVKARGQSHSKSEALTAAGHAALQAEGFDKAIGYFEKALEDWRDNPAARTGLVTAIARQRTSAKDRALQLADTYVARGQWDAARDQYLLALAADPKDKQVQDHLASRVALRPVPGARAVLKAWSDVLNESLTWIVLVAAAGGVLVANLVNRRASRHSVDVLPFDGPGNFRQETGAAMAAIASSQLHGAGFVLEPGVVAEPLTALSGKLTDTQAKLLGEVLAWLFPARGFRLQAVVFEFPNSRTTRVTAKLIRLRFWAPREQIMATVTFGQAAQGAVHETLARLTAAWAEWHVMRSHRER